MLKLDQNLLPIGQVMETIIISLILVIILILLTIMYNKKSETYAYSRA